MSQNADVEDIRSLFWSKEANAFAFIAMYTF